MSLDAQEKEQRSCVALQSEPLIKNSPLWGVFLYLHGRRAAGWWLIRLCQRAAMLSVERILRLCLEKVENEHGRRASTTGARQVGG